MCQMRVSNQKSRTAQKWDMWTEFMAFWQITQNNITNLRKMVGRNILKHKPMVSEKLHLLN